MAPVTIQFGAGEWAAIAPFSVVAISAMALLMYETFSEESQGDRSVWIALAAVAASVATTIHYASPDAVGFGGSLALDGVAAFTNVVCALATAMSILMAPSYLGMVGVRLREYLPLVLFTLAGMMIMAGARDLIILFLGVEIMSIPAYVLAGVHRRDRRSGEASLKYFVLGAFATAFLLYGIALLYGATGSTAYKGVADMLADAPPVTVLAGVSFLIVALGFKVGVVPFHFWAPDVYQGAPTSVTALMAVGVKAAAVAATARLFIVGLAGIHVDWSVLLWWVSVLTMTLGNVVAIAQSNVKRMLAYSSIAHAGYLVAAIAVGTAHAGGAILFYLLAYAFMNLGAFAVVIAVGAKGEANELISDYAGLGERRPLLAGSMAIFLLSLMGIPPLVGFAGKLYVIEAIVQAGQLSLAIILILNSVVSGYYYLRLVIEMFMREPSGEAAEIEARPFLAACVVIATVGTVLLGIFPEGALELARESFQGLR